MKITPKQYGILLYQMTKDLKEGELPGVLKSFVLYLVKGRELSKLPRIVSFFKEEFRKQEGILEAHIKSARPLSQNLVEKIKTMIGYERVHISTSVDPSLVGGFTLHYNDTVIDASVRSQLRELTATLQR